MKQKDIALLILIAAISGVVSFVLSQYLFLTPQNTQQSVAIVDKITTDFATPSPTVFNATAIDPSKTIQVGSGSNTNPFSHTGH